jgi:hypothetical protein
MVGDMAFPLAALPPMEIYITVDAELMTRVRNQKLVLFQLLTEFWTPLNISPMLLTRTMLLHTI